MCGIAGVYNKAGLVNGQVLIRRGLERMNYRGPDYTGVWSSPDKHIHFGHARLSIIDLDSRSNQPFKSENNQCIITFNGEIYNYKELKSVLIEEHAERFNTSSDTEVLLKYYEYFGIEKTCKDIRGMYAFVICDLKNNRFVGARDAAGEKPFYYFYNNTSFAFASELSALSEILPKVKSTINLNSLDYLLAYGYVPSGKSLLEGVRKLKPGHFFKYSLTERKLVENIFWSVPNFTEPFAENTNNYVSRFIDLGSSIIQEQLVSDVPLAITLSGGLDSSIVTALAARASSIPVNTFSVTFPGDEKYDESSYSRLVSEYFSTNHYELPIEEVPDIDFQEVLSNLDEPIFDSSFLPTYLITNAIKQAGFTVVVGGDGGDELFGGYAWYRSTMNRITNYQFRMNLPKPLLKFIFESNGFKKHPKRFWVESFFGKSNTLPLSPGFLNQAERNDLFPILKSLNRRAEAVRFEEVNTELVSYIRRASNFDFNTYLPNDVLVKVDRASMQNSVESRAPFLDKRMIEFAMGQVPDNLKTNKSHQKILLQKVAREILPTSFETNRKVGFGFPNDKMDRLIDEELPARFQEILSFKKHKLKNSKSLSHLRFGLHAFNIWLGKYES